MDESKDQSGASPSFTGCRGDQHVHFIQHEDGCAEYLLVTIQDEGPCQSGDVPVFADALLSEADALQFEQALAKWRQSREHARSRAKPSTTIFECRTCASSISCRNDDDDVEFRSRHWKRIRRIDGPNAICPMCQIDIRSLDSLKEDGYEDAYVE